jgi:NAD(P)-dependent dehydrogenase (short-subunit alcohol dehydrogenase family)
MHHRGREVLGDAIYDNILSQRVHARSTGRPEEIARQIVFLCSNDASYITSTTLTV